MVSANPVRSCTRADAWCRAAGAGRATSCFSRKSPTKRRWRRSAKRASFSTRHYPCLSVSRYQIASAPCKRSLLAHPQVTLALVTCARPLQASPKHYLHVPSMCRRKVESPSLCTFRSTHEPAMPAGNASCILSWSRCRPISCGDYGSVPNATWLSATSRLGYQEGALSFACNAGESCRRAPRAMCGDAFQCWCLAPRAPSFVCGGLCVWRLCACGVYSA